MATPTRITSFAALVVVLTVDQITIATGNFSEWPTPLLSRTHAATAVVRAAFALRCIAFLSDSAMVATLTVPVLHMLCQHSLLQHKQRQL